MKSFITLARKALYPLLGLITSETIIWFGLPAVLARALSPEDWGRYSILVFLAALPMVLVFATSVEDSTLARFMVERRARATSGQGKSGDERRIYSTMMTVWCLASVIAILVIRLLSPMLCTKYKLPELTSWLWLAALPPLVLTPMVNHMLASIQGYQRIKRWAVSRGISTLSAFAVISICSAFGLITSLERAILIVAVGWIVALVVAMVGARKPLGRLLPDRPDFATVRLLMKFLFSAQASPVVGASVALLQPYLLSHSVGPVAVGHYAIGRSVLLFLGLAHAAIMVPLLPDWAHLYEQRDGKALLRSIRDVRKMLILVGVIYAGIFFCTREHLVGLLFGQAMTPATPAVLAMVASGPFLLGGWVGGSCCILGKRPYIIAIVNVVWGAFLIATSFFLIPRYGALGASLAWLAGYIAFFCSYFFLLRPFFRQLREWAREQETAILDEEAIVAVHE